MLPRRFPAVDNDPQTETLTGTAWTAWTAAGIDPAHRRPVVRLALAALAATCAVALALPPLTAAAGRAAAFSLASSPLDPPESPGDARADLPVVPDGDNREGLLRAAACPRGWAMREPGPAAVTWCTSGPAPAPLGTDPAVAVHDLDVDQSGRWAARPAPAGCTAHAGPAVRVLVVGVAPPAKAAMVAAQSSSALPDAAVAARIAEVDDLMRLAALDGGGRRQVRWAGRADGGCALAVTRLDVAPSELRDAARTAAALRRAGLVRPDQVQLVLTTARRYCAITLLPTPRGAASLGMLRVDAGCRRGQLLADALTPLTGPVSTNVPGWGRDAVVVPAPAAAPHAPALAADGTLALLAGGATSGAGKVWLRAPGEAWRTLDGDVRQVALVDRGSLWAVGDDGLLWRWLDDGSAGGSWTHQGEGVVAVAAAPDGTVAVLRGARGAACGRPWVFDPATGAWTPWPGTLCGLAVGAGHELWAVDEAGALWSGTAGQWRHRADAARSVSAAADGTVVVLQRDGRLRRIGGPGSSGAGSTTPPAPAMPLPGEAAEIAVGGDGDLVALTGRAGLDGSPLDPGPTGRVLRIGRHDG